MGFNGAVCQTSFYSFLQHKIYAIFILCIANGGKKCSDLIFAFDFIGNFPLYLTLLLDTGIKSGLVKTVEWILINKVSNKVPFYGPPLTFNSLFRGIWW